MNRSKHRPYMFQGHLIQRIQIVLTRASIIKGRTGSLSSVAHTGTVVAITSRVWRALAGNSECHPEGYPTILRCDPYCPPPYPCPLVPPQFYGPDLIAKSYVAASCAFLAWVHGVPTGRPIQDIGSYPCPMSPTSSTVLYEYATSKAPVHILLKTGFFEDIFKIRLRTPVHILLKTGFFEDIFKTAPNRFEERRFLQTLRGVLKNGFEEIRPSYGVALRSDF